MAIIADISLPGRGAFAAYIRIASAGIYRSGEGWRLTYTAAVRVPEVIDDEPREVFHTLDFVGSAEGALDVNLVAAAYADLKTQPFLSNVDDA